MGGLLGEMTVRLGVNTSQFTSGLGGAQSTLQGFASKAASISPIAGGIVALGAAAIGFGAASVKMAADYQQSMTMVQQLTGSSSDQMKKYSDGIRSLSNETGKSSMDLTKGLYQVISAGFQGADAMKILSLSSKDSVISMSDQETTTKALVVALGSYGLGAKDADNVSAQMLKTVSLGRMSLNDYAGALSTGAAAAHKHGISLAEMNATLSTLTSGGVKTAGVAMTDFTGLLTSMDTKTDLMTKRIHSLGLSFDEDKFKTMSYQEKIAYLNDTMKNNKSMEDWVLQSKNAGQALAILGSHADMLKSDISQLSDKQKLAKDSAAAWAATQNTFNQSMARLQTQFQNIMIDVGSKLLPILSKVVANVAPIVSSFADWLSKSNAVGGGIDFIQGLAARLWPTLEDVGKQLLPLVKQFQDWAIKNDVAGKSAKVLTLIVDGIGDALKFATPLVVQIAQEFGKFAQDIGTRLMPILQNLSTWWHQHWPAMKEIFTGAWNIMQGIFKLSWATISGDLKIGLDLLSGNWKKAWTDMQATGKNQMTGIKQIFTGWKQEAKGAADNVLISMGILKNGVQRDTDEAAKQSKINTLNMKKAVVDNTIAMQKESLKETDKMIEGIADKLKKAKDPVEKGHLQLQLIALQHSRNTKDGVIHNAELQKQGIEDKLNDLKKSSASIWGDTVKKIQDIVTNAKKWITDTWKSISDGVINAFKWLYDHNYYWKSMCDTIRNVTNDVKNWLIGAWNNTSKFIQDRWNELSGFARNAWKSVSDVFSGIWNNYLSKPLNDAWNSISGFWNNTIVPGATSLGQGFVNAIVSGLSGLGGAIHDAIQNALGGMGFHDIPGFSLPGHKDGILNSPRAHWAIVGEKGPELMHIGQGDSVYPTGTGPATSGGGMSFDGGGSQTIIVELDGNVLMQGLGDKQAQYIRLRHGRRVA